ncbi:hypothetical protein L7E55_11665 [Pelotomaculum isophthalicicum JI]|uniref:Uncharacterized protein n=1 Tax=Pelotomaculum isophthalicicum JI TaxID=947010 RepID=A0A9X4JTM7_9FIRM|nr:hypothetical protein [Pelotomaculum isophthalicicum]MDF9409009.1 hypothetical protein [Pelotomaculum isophthalicicum JI]
MKVLFLVLSVIVALVFLPGGMARWEHDAEITGKIHTGNWNKHHHSAPENTSGDYPTLIGDTGADDRPEVIPCDYEREGLGNFQ